MQDCQRSYEALEAATGRRVRIRDEPEQYTFELVQYKKDDRSEQAVHALAWLLGRLRLHETLVRLVLARAWIRNAAYQRNMRWHPFTEQISSLGDLQRKFIPASLPALWWPSLPRMQLSGPPWRPL